MEFSGPDREAVGVRCNDLLGITLVLVSRTIRFFVATAVFAYPTHDRVVDGAFASLAPDSQERTRKASNARLHVAFRREVHPGENRDFRGFGFFAVDMADGFVLVLKTGTLGCQQPEEISFVV